MASQIDDELKHVTRDLELLDVELVGREEGFTGDLADRDPHRDLELILVDNLECVGEDLSTLIVRLFNGGIIVHTAVAHTTNDENILIRLVSDPHYW